ncbi:NADPH-dependent aldehyde reductase Ahr [Litoribrevibacter albus]|uniref:alcohol dehydrogenase (NADP(+)) n=1 Tax=Litoribrevibacter albus TaxID=1473156 RepID=A0AA37S8K4_9GAMM|nr:NAD(P)-dependent alcohol dehydrogenase [Litoribrevibacter albus]GLQ30406.1 alcohol dehydrogenase [Litoribrevibacter albus]
MIRAFAAFEPKGERQPFEFDPGALKASEIEINVEYCGICHSDLSMLNNEWGMTSYPFVPGHEVIGTISAVGSQVSQFAEGDWVGLGWHSDYCHDCRSCNTGDHNLCSDAQGTIIGRHGGFADKVRADASSVVALPSHIDKAIAGPLFCAGITVFNPLVQFDIKPTDKVAVIGIGGLGHLALQFLNAWGCEVTAFTSSEAKTKEALELGAHSVINSRDKNAISAAKNQFDLIISTVDVKLDWNRYVNTLAPKGRLHFVGATLEPLDISVFGLMGAQRSVSSSPVGSPSTIATMLDFAGRHKIKPIIEEFRFDQVNEAMKRLESGDARYRIVLKR